MHASDLKYCIRDIEFRWINRTVIVKSDKPIDVTVEERVLQYRTQRGDGFRGWSDWYDVGEENEASK